MAKTAVTGLSSLEFAHAGWSVPALSHHFKPKGDGRAWVVPVESSSQLCVSRHGYV